MDNVRLAFLFHRYVNNICSESERKELLNLLDDAGNDQQVKILMEELWNDVSGTQLSSIQSERILHKILEDKTLLQPTPGFAWVKIAATLLITILCGAGLVYFKSFKSSNHRVDFETHSKATPRFIKLPDGSTVVLNAGSKLEYPDPFADNTREVFLEGEGYFDIIHDVAREFIVHTGDLKTTVLGTAFNIKAYPDQENITVTVKRGKVKVSDDQKIFGVVNPNQQITFDRNQHLAKQEAVDSEEVIAWMEKDIFFDDVTVSEAIDQLEKRFDISILIANDQIKNCKLTATFVKGEDLEQILRIICEFNNAKLKEDNSGGFVIDGGECPL